MSSKHIFFESLDWLHGAILVGLVALALKLFKKRPRHLPELQGPPTAGWLAGHSAAVFGGNVGEPTFDWTVRYGRAYIIDAPLGNKTLALSDWLAVGYILRNFTIFERAAAERRIQGFITGSNGLGVTVKQQHARERRIMQPAFSANLLDDLVPLFQSQVEQLRLRWCVKIEESPDAVMRANLMRDLTATTAEALALFAFGTQLGHIQRLDREEMPYLLALRKIFSGSAARFSNWGWAMRSIAGDLAVSPRMTKILQTFGLARELAFVESQQSIVRKFAEAVVLEQRRALECGDGIASKNIMGLLLKANQAEKDPSKRMSHEEMVDQVISLLVAGQDTTAISTSWTLYELSQHPDIQQRVRADLRAAREGRGTCTLSLQDLSNLPLLAAVVKETLRFHPVVWRMFRETTQHTVIPLSQPIVLRDGTKLEELPLEPGIKIFVDLASVNRSPDIWGPDAHTWRPERWLENNPYIASHAEKKVPGVIGHIISFSEGPGHCIGWRFAMAQMQTILALLLDDFDFRLQPGTTIERRAAGIMGPAANKQYGLFNMPLEIRQAQ